MNGQGNLDWIAESSESIDARLEAVKASQTQTRITLVAMAIISAMMLIACYNAYFSYDYRYITENHKRRLSNHTAPDVLMSQALRDWAASRSIQVSLLGIRVSVDDASVLGTAVLAVLALWLVLVTRRENHSIGFLLRDTDTLRPVASNRGNDERWLIFHTIAANALFETTDASLVPIDSLGGPNPLRAPVKGFTRWANVRGFKLIRDFFFMFPLITALIIFAIDRHSYFVSDPFDVNGDIPGIDDPFFWQSQAMFCIALIPLALCCEKAREFSNATETVLRQYAAKLFRDVSAPPPLRDAAGL